MATCHLQKYHVSCSGRAVLLVVFPKWQIQGLHRVKALVLSIEILCFHWKDLKSDFRKVSHWQFSVMFFGRSKNSDDFQQKFYHHFLEAMFLLRSLFLSLQNPMVCTTKARSFDRLRRFRDISGTLHQWYLDICQQFSTLLERNAVQLLGLVTMSDGWS